MWTAFLSNLTPKIKISTGIYFKNLFILFMILKQICDAKN